MQIAGHADQALGPTEDADELGEAGHQADDAAWWGGKGDRPSDVIDELAPHLRILP